MSKWLTVGIAAVAGALPAAMQVGVLPPVAAQLGAALLAAVLAARRSVLSSNTPE